jgi:hypothetical protein
MSQPGGNIMYATAPHRDLANQRVAWLLEQAEHDRLVAQARRARRQRRRPRRLTWALRAFAPQAAQQHAGAR